VSVDARGKNLNRQAAKIAGGGRGEEDFGFWILDFGFWILDFGFWILDFGFWILDFGFWILDFGFWILDGKGVL
jgi:hypothetical protein